MISTYLSFYDIFINLRPLREPLHTIPEHSLHVTTPRKHTPRLNPYPLPSSRSLHFQRTTHTSSFIRHTRHTRPSRSMILWVAGFLYYSCYMALAHAPCLRPSASPVFSFFSLDAYCGVTLHCTLRLYLAVLHNTKPYPNTVVPYVNQHNTGRFQILSPWASRPGEAGGGGTGSTSSDPSKSDSKDMVECVRPGRAPPPCA